MTFIFPDVVLAPFAPLFTALTSDRYIRRRRTRKQIWDRIHKMIGKTTSYYQNGKGKPWPCLLHDQIDFGLYYDAGAFAICSINAFGLSRRGVLFKIKQELNSS
jgi:hypothetical protein